MKFIKNMFTIIIFAMTLMPVGVLANDVIVDRNTVINDGNGVITGPVRNNNMIEIDGNTYFLTRNTKFGYMISPTSITYIDRAEFPLNVGDVMYYTVDSSASNSRYPRINFIYKRVD